MIILIFFLKQNEVEQEKLTEELIKTDVSKLTKRQKLQVLQKESPELFGLIDDFKSRYLHLV